MVRPAGAGQKTTEGVLRRLGATDEMLARDRAFSSTIRASRHRRGGEIATLLMPAQRRRMGSASSRARHAAPPGVAVDDRALAQTSTADRTVPAVVDAGLQRHGELEGVAVVRRVRATEPSPARASRRESRALQSSPVLERQPANRSAFRPSMASSRAPAQGDQARRAKAASPGSRGRTAGRVDSEPGRLERLRIVV